MFTAHSETFSGHCVYGLTAIAALSYATKLGGGYPSAIPIAWLQVTSLTVRLIYSCSKSSARTRLSWNKIVLLGLFYPTTAASFAKASSVICVSVKALLNN